MSLFSRLFRKTPTPSVSRPSPAEKAAKAVPKPSEAERAQAAAAEQRALQAALDAGDVQAVARLVVSGSSTRIRQAAAEAIEDPEILRQLIRDVRGGNDKSVYKVLTTKRDAQLAHARSREQLGAEIAAAAEALERLSRRAYDSLSNGKLAQAENRWQAVAAEAEPALRERVQQWIDLSRQAIDEHARQLAEQAAREQAAADAATEARRQREAQALAAAEAAAEQARIDDEQRRAQAQARQIEQQPARELGDLIRKARAALNDGNTGRAAGVRRTIEEKLAATPGLPGNLAGALQQLDAQLEELKDWKHFSVAPKRVELIESMEALIGIESEPLALAERIKQLQDQWRTLSKGAGENSDVDWQRFKDAAQKAYQPCSEYFAAQALIQQENLQRREALLAQLTAFEASQPWEQADWSAVVRTLRDTKQAWREHSPVEPQAGRKQQARFSKLLTSMQDRLDAEYARNVKQKEALIERARDLLAGDDDRKAIDAVKDLQKKWQAVGPVPRDADQGLWKQFRQHCDAVFQKREQASAAQAAALENNRAQAVALCEQIEQIAALEGAELQANAAALAELRKAFDALGEFPRADARALRTRYEQGLERYRKATAREQARAAERVWTDLFEAAGPVRAYRLALARGADAAQLDALKAAAEARIAAVQKWPKNGLDALRQALGAEAAADLAANEIALRTLCIRAEMLTDTATPAEDQALRREFQLQRLVQSMGQGLKADEAQLDALAIEWVAAAAVDDAVHAPLLQRFLRCRERASFAAA
ncbi:MAG TPA: DUF349 domain-containing protein [Fontimonas sp.]